MPEADGLTAGCGVVEEGASSRAPSPPARGLGERKLSQRGPGQSRGSWYWCIFGLQKSPMFVHNTLFTCHSFVITGHDSLRPIRVPIAAGEAQATSGWTKPPYPPHT